MLEQLQDHLEAIYGYSCGERAERFVVSAEAARQLGGSVRAPEELLVAEAGGALEVALYLDPALLAWAHAHGEEPAARVMDANLDSFCQLTEGVSHFMYLARAAQEDRHVSLLELEAQAEVDKFASCLLHRWGEGVLQWARLLLHRLFEKISYREGLSDAERWRYQEANRLARSYCGRLMPHVQERRLDRLLGELRHMYRLGAEAKLQYLAVAAR
ncbi:MAG TPA: hypothetical protein VND93_27385 [Myxococcales bacterium]|nr:hypothetical protein [Myxococcales bacterium]